MSKAIDRIIVHTLCPTCGARIEAPYLQVRSIKLFACGCGTIVDADLDRVATQAIISLAEEEGAVKAPLRP